MLIREKKMKLIIDLPEKIVTAIQNGEDYRYDIHTVIAQGIPHEKQLIGEWKLMGFVGMKYAWCKCSNCHKTTKIHMDSRNEFCSIADITKKSSCLFTLWSKDAGR